MTRHAGLIDRHDLVLVVVDMQERLASAMGRREEVESAAARLVRVAGILEVPVIVTRQYPDGLGDTVEPVRSAIAELPEEALRVVDKTAFCACDEPAFIDALDGTGRHQVALLGMETHICVTQTALTLRHLGYRVHVCADASCSRRREDHDVALARLSAEGVVVPASESVMYEALGRAGTDDFRRVLRVVKGS